MTLDMLAAALAADRPFSGSTARLSMLPGFRREPDTHRSSGPWRQAAVLVLLYPDEGVIHFPLMQRPAGEGVHAGQVSLPGGSREGGESLQDCALRETQEELGVMPADISIVKELGTLEVEPSRFIVHPFLGLSRRRPSFRPSPDEVVCIFEPSLDELHDRSNRQSDVALYKGCSYTVPFFRLSGQRVWGLTAMILAELEAMLAAGIAGTPG